MPMDLHEKMIYAAKFQKLDEEIQRLRKELNDLKSKPRLPNPKRTRAKFSPEVRKARGQLRTAKARAAKAFGDGSGSIKDMDILRKLERDVRDAEKRLANLMHGET